MTDTTLHEDTTEELGAIRLPVRFEGQNLFLDVVPVS